jgi:hypothetical protein
MKHSIRVPCHVCDTKGTVEDEEMSTGWRVCSFCHGQCWLDETPQPVEPHPDPLAVPSLTE